MVKKYNANKNNQKVYPTVIKEKSIKISPIDS